MSTKARQYEAQVLRREQLSDHFVRIVLGGAGLTGFASTGIPDEWVGLIVPGQFQSRYYTVRSWDPAIGEAGELVLDVVVHDVGLVTEWARTDVVGQTVIQGTCTTCHDAPGVGNHSVSLPVDIGVADASRRTPDMPLYTLTINVTGETIQTTDPGKALLSGKWQDIGKFKGPILRGLAGRPPYFHNGMAATLGDVVDFYNTRFAIGFSDGEKQDLVAFLAAL